MIANLENIQILETGLKAAFNKGLQITTEGRQVERLATVITSTSRKEFYPFLGAIPQMREWTGDRQIKTIRGDKYELANRDFEMTLSLDRKDIEDDNLGMLPYDAEMFGMETNDHRFRLVVEALQANTACYDGFSFFSDAHVSDKESAQSNISTGGADPWYLMDLSKPLRPFIFQERKKAELVSKTSPNDDNVFWQRKLVWGVDARYAAGYGYWQFAHKSTATLNETNLAAARAQMRKLKDTTGRYLNVMPTHLVVSPADQYTAEKLIEQVVIASGESNAMRGKFQLLVINELT